MHVSDAVGILDGGHIPREIKLVGGVALLVNGRVRNRREFGAIRTRSEGHSGGLGVLANLVAARVAREPGRQFGFVTQPGQTGCDVEH